MHPATDPARPTSIARTLRSAALLLCILLACVAVQHSAQAQSQTGQQPSGEPPSGPPPGGDPGGMPDTSSSSSSGSPLQGRHAGPPSPAMELDRIIAAMKAAGVALTDAQKVDILGILEDKQTAMQLLQSSASTSTDRGASMQQALALQKAARTAILAVLTEAQQKIYASLREGPPSRPGTSGSSGGATGSTPPDNSNIDANTGGGIVQN